jgi:DNA-binding transcriptional ArsR family regulator
MQDEQLDQILKALAHPERRRILSSLQRRPEQSLFEICVAALGENEQPLSRQTVSQHLDMLERAGLIETTWKGRTKAHSIKLGPLRAAIRLLLKHYSQ